MRLRRLFFGTILVAFSVPAVSAPGPSDALLTAQILLDRAHQSPGVIDGQAGTNTRRAISAFEEANGMPVDGMLDPYVTERLQAFAGEALFMDHLVTNGDVDDLVEVPTAMTDQAALEHLGFETAVEALAERFHMSQKLLRALNPASTFAVGETIRVVQAGSEPLDRRVGRIEIDKGRAELRAFADDGEIIATYPASIGSATFPSPNGNMEVRAVAPAPTYYFNPEGRNWGPEQKLTIAAGPNNPVGSTWIDLTKEGYGIHGTPDPRLIGKTASHGCVRLTNWDAAELAAAVGPGTVVKFL